MTLGSMDGKTTSAGEQPCFTIMPEESGGGKKSRVTRKHVIIGVTCAVMVAVVIAGVLLGVKFHLDSANEIVTRTFEFTFNNKQLKEDVEVDVKDNFVQYYMKDEDRDIWIIDDFNRELRVTKMATGVETKCFLTALNSSESASPQAVLQIRPPNEPVEEVHKYYAVSKTSIKDKSMLGRHGEKLCDNVDVHWMIETCSADRSNAMSVMSTRQHARDKRDADFCTCNVCRPSCNPYCIVICTPVPCSCGGSGSILV